MEIFCVYTPSYDDSKDSAKRCVDTGRSFNYKVQLYESVHWSELKQIHKKLNIKSKYIGVDSKTTDFEKRTCPKFRIANGTTHYLLYLHCVEIGKPICILEHDAYFVNKLPKPKINGVIQISSHQDRQITKKYLFECGRAYKMRRHEPEKSLVWPKTKGVVQHPLSGTIGTSGYIIHPTAAQKMIDYIKEDGIGFADRIRTEHIGENNLWLQIPQAVECSRLKIKYN